MCALAGLDGDTGCRTAVCQQFAHSFISAYVATWAADDAAARVLATVCVRMGVEVLTTVWRRPHMIGGGVDALTTCWGRPHVNWRGGGCADHMLATKTAGKAGWLLRLVLDRIHALALEGTHLDSMACT